jgi:Tfp pilus assembly protein PilF
LYLRQGKLAGARELFEQVLGHMPHNYVARNNLGVIYMQQHDYVRAILELRKALWENSAYANAHYNLAICYTQLDPPDYCRADQHLQLARAFHHPVPQSVIDEIERHKVETHQP